MWDYHRDRQTKNPVVLNRRTGRAAMGIESGTIIEAGCWPWEKAYRQSLRTIFWQGVRMSKGCNKRFNG